MKAPILASNRLTPMIGRADLVIAHRLQGPAGARAHHIGDEERGQRQNRRDDEEELLPGGKRDAEEIVLLIDRCITERGRQHAAAGIATCQEGGVFEDCTPMTTSASETMPR